MVAVGGVLLNWPVRTQRAIWAISVDTQKPRRKAVGCGSFAHPLLVLARSVRFGTVRMDALGRVLAGVSMVVLGAFGLLRS